LADEIAHRDDPERMAGLPQLSQHAIESGLELQFQPMHALGNGIDLPPPIRGDVTVAGFSGALDQRPSHALLRVAAFAQTPPERRRDVGMRQAPDR
jgi:hypothetical protein